jgi:hypothetical protein
MESSLTGVVTCQCCTGRNHLENSLCNKSRSPPSAQNNRANLKIQTSAPASRFVLAVVESLSPGLAHAVGTGFAVKNPEKLAKNG